MAQLTRYQVKQLLAAYKTVHYVTDPSPMCEVLTVAMTELQRFDIERTISQAMYELEDPAKKA